MEQIGNLILPNQILYGGKITCENGVITAITKLDIETDSLPYIAPGFVDIHNHGALGHDYMESDPKTFRRIADYLASHGVTSAQCATVSAPVKQLLAFFESYRAYQKSQKDDTCRFVGIHLEGPYLSPAGKGAHPLDTLLTPKKDGYDFVLENSDIIREITVAPDLPDMPQMIRDLVAKQILVSGGHDNSEPEDVEQAAKAGMKHCTHIYCAMSTLHKTNGHRVHGLCEYAMTHDNLTAEIIGDNQHTPPYLAKMVYHAKGADKLCLVSDAISPAGLPPREECYLLGAGENCTKVIVEDGVAMIEDRTSYAGSIQALDQMVRNMVTSADIPLVDAVRMASLTPATILGIDKDCGSIEVGKRCDLCFLNEKLEVEKTVIGGKTIFEKEKANATE